MPRLKRRVIVEGLNLERLIRSAAEEGVRLRGMRRRGRRIICGVDDADIARLQQLCDSGGWRMSGGARLGAGRLLDALKRHAMLVCVCALSAAAAFLSTQVIWQVHADAPQTYAADLRGYLVQCGIDPPVWRRSVNLSALRDALEWRYPSIAWADCGWRGPVLHIRLIDGTAAGKSVSPAGSGDVVAARDGVVDSIMTTAGTACVNPGDVVRRGDTLIRGAERGAAGTEHPVMARGIVLARVWEAAAVRIPVTASETQYTGRTVTNWSVSGPFFALRRKGEAPFLCEDISVCAMPLGGIFLPFVLRIETHLEADVSMRMRKLDEIKLEAEAAAMRKLRDQLGFRDDLVDKWVDYCMIESEVLEAIAVGERLMDIAQPQRYE